MILNYIGIKIVIEMTIEIEEMMVVGIGIGKINTYVYIHV
jgi:hypothetical protein